LHLNRWQALTEVAIAARKLGARLGVFSPTTDLRDFGAGLRAHQNVALSSVEPEHVVSTLRRGAIVLHVESRAPDVSTFTRLSVSTKLPQCLASGRPILAYGPSQLASMRLVTRSGAGLIAEAPEQLVTAISKLLINANLRGRLAHAGETYARANFSRQTLLRRLRDVLHAASQAPKREAPAR
jgi:glycosyltransferase involved in cell wall biosynthesis